VAAISQELDVAAITADRLRELEALEEFGAVEVAGLVDGRVSGRALSRSVGKGPQSVRASSAPTLGSSHAWRFLSHKTSVSFWGES
jgi:hypothetical protein